MEIKKKKFLSFAFWLEGKGGVIFVVPRKVNRLESSKYT